MRLRRLGWAGVELESGGERVVIDMLVNPGMFEAFLGDDPDQLVEPEAGLSAALLTHLHRDHADIATIDRLLRDEAPVIRPYPAERTELDELTTGAVERELDGLRRPVRQVAANETVSLGPFQATSVEAVDGLGSPQVSWVVTDGAHTIFHGGDTLWHGRWWHIAAAHGPFDIALLPANGVVLEYPLFQPAVSVPAALTPHEAVEAARALQAATLAPIHFNATFSKEPYYRPLADAGAQAASFGEQREQRVRLLKPGQWIDLPDAEVRQEVR